jgi:ParB family chromosome partitioning protein
VVVSFGGKSAPVDEEEDDGIKPLPERLVIELTAHRTLALRDAVAQNPHVAMTALLHKLVSDAFHHRSANGALEAQVRHIFFPAQADDLGSSQSVKSVDERNELWKGRIPADDIGLWDWLAGLGDDDRMALLAHCVSYGVNALYERPNPYSSSGVSEHGLQLRLDQADRLARETGLDMVQVGWRPTVGNYLGRVTKARIIEAVREGAGDRAAQLIDHMKKGDMAKEAERLLADTGWLPEPLRMAEPGEVAAARSTPADQEDGDAALPAFLVDDSDEEEPTESDDEDALSIAAE